MPNGSALLILAIGSVADAQSLHGGMPVIESGVAKSALDICTNAYAAICEAKPAFVGEVPANADIFKKVSAAMGGKSPFGELELKLGKMEAADENPEAIASYRALMKRVHSAVMDEWAKRHVTDDQIREQVEETKSILVRHYLPKSKDAAKKLKEVRLMTAMDLDRLTDDEVLDFYFSCGVDGLSAQAVHDQKSNTLTLCPGYLLDAARRFSDRRLMVDAIGHELHHAVDPTSGIRQLDPVYAKFLKCLGRSPSMEGEITMAKARENFESERDSLAASMRRLRMRNPPNREVMLEVAIKMNKNESRLQALELWEALFDDKLGRSPTKVESHANEFFADAGTAIALADLAAKERAAARNPTELIRASLSGYCPLASGDEAPDGMHASPKFRIEKMMSNPELRKALTCTAPSVEEWCPL